MFIDHPRGRANTPKEYYTRVLERLEIPVNPELVEKLASKAAELEKIRLYPDVVPTVDVLKTREIKTAIVTTIPSWRFAPTLEKAHVKIDFICTAREAKAVKPNPKIYLTALNRLGVKPNEALMVGDDLATDVKPPKELGMKAVWLCRKGKPEQVQADHMVSSLTELLDLI
jgi:putative hydrolase of the HAD superfamily